MQAWWESEKDAYLGGNVQDLRDAFMEKVTPRDMVFVTLGKIEDWSRVSGTIPSGLGSSRGINNCSDKQLVKFNINTYCRRVSPNNC